MRPFAVAMHDGGEARSAQSVQDKEEGRRAAEDRVLNYHRSLAYDGAPPRARGFGRPWTALEEDLQFTLAIRWVARVRSRHA